MMSIVGSGWRGERGAALEERVSVGNDKNNCERGRGAATGEYLYARTRKKDVVVQRWN